MKPVLAIILVLAGTAGGAGLGAWLRPGEVAPPGPPVRDPANPTGGRTGADASGPVDPAGESARLDYVRLDRQMVIPVVEGGRTRALMLFEIGLAMRPGARERVFALEPRLRDAFLRDFFEMSYTGAFLTTYTDDRVVSELRAKLLDSARSYLGEDVSEVLLLDMIRQEY